MNREHQPVNYRLLILVITVVFVPGIARAVDSETRGSQTLQLQSAAGLQPKAPQEKEMTKAAVFVRPVLPANVVPAQTSVHMPRNEKIRILPLTLAKVPVASVFTKTVQPSVFKPHPVAQPAVSPLQRLAEKAAVEQTS